MPPILGSVHRNDHDKSSHVLDFAKTFRPNMRIRDEIIHFLVVHPNDSNPIISHVPTFTMLGALETIPQKHVVVVVVCFCPMN